MTCEACEASESELEEGLLAAPAQHVGWKLLGGLAVLSGTALLLGRHLVAPAAAQQAELTQQWAMSRDLLTDDDQKEIGALGFDFQALS